MLALALGATLIGLVTNIFVWKMPRTSNMVSTWATVSITIAIVTLLFVATFITDNGQAWWMLPAVVFFLALPKAIRSWGAAERARFNEQPSTWLGTLEALSMAHTFSAGSMQPDTEMTGWFQLEDLREFAFGANGLLLHHNPEAPHWCTVTSTAGLDLPQIIQIAQRHECQEVMAA
jgi:hypothetical protein